MTHVSVEYAHIYTNQAINPDHQRSVTALPKACETIKAGGNTASLVVMVDDYSFPDPSFDYSGFLDWLELNDSKPNLLFRESQLIPSCDEVLGFMKANNLRGQIIDYIIKTKRYPCSLFIAAWYLLRLGELQSPLFPKELQADSLLNILPEDFKHFEDRGIEIIKSTPFREASQSIQYILFPSEHPIRKSTR